MSSNDTEPKAKKQRVDSGEDQDVSMTIGAVNDGISPQVQNEAVKTVSSTPVPGSYSFTITNGQLINTNTNQNSASLLPRVPQNIQLANPGIHQIRPVVSPVTMAPGQITLATGGMGIRPGITMASVIRPALQFQTINSPTVPGGQTKVLTAATGPIRVPLQVSQPQIGVPGPQGQTRPVQMLPVQQAWTLDGKMTLQIANNTVRAVHPRGNTGLPQGIAFTTPQIRTAVPTIAVHKNGQVSVLQKPGNQMTKVSSAGDIQTPQKLQSSAQPVIDQPSVSSPQPQISFQVPLNWSGTGNNKSLLDSGKLSVLSAAQTGNQSVKPQSSASLLDPASPTVTAEPMSTGYQTLLTTSSINSTGLGTGINLPSGMSLTPIQKPITSVTIPGVPKLTAAKGGSFVLSSGNKVAFVPSSQVVTQIVKTDNKSVGKVTMAEAQIMLPSGPAKISWPVPPQTKDGKHIVLTKSGVPPGPSPVKSHTGGVIRPSSVSASLIASSKLVTDGGGHSKFLVQGNSAARPQKNLILQTQRSWELVKQASLLMPKKHLPSTTQDTKARLSEKTVDENKAETEMNNKTDEVVDDQADVNNELEHPDDKSKEVQDGSKVEQNETKTEQLEENSDNIDTVTSYKQDEKELCISLINEAMTKDSENNNEPCKNMETDSISEEYNNKQESGTNKETLNENNEREALVTVTESDSTELNAGETKTDSDNTTNVENGDERDVKLEAMDIDDIGGKEKDSVDDMKGAGGDGADFDAVGAMEWKDGVGELPGSDLKFRMNDLGVLEVITDDLLCNETLNTSSESEKSSKEKAQTIKEEPGSEPVKKEPSTEVPSVSNKDKIIQCENCGEYGFITDFYKDGRFCSQTCIGAFDSKRMREVKRHGAMSRVMLGLKNKRKKLLLKGGLNRNLDIKKEPGLHGGKKPKAFIWAKYLNDENAIDTPPKLFKNPFPSARNNFRVGLRLEGVDPSHQALYCVLTVAELCGFRIRLHFDGYSECYDFWTDIDSPYIFPVGFCEKNNKLLHPPKGFAIDDFSWSAYLKMTRGAAAPKSLFTNQPVQSVTPNSFRIGSKLEAVDKKNSSLICVATVADTMGDKILVHFDGWDNNYDYWCDVTSPFIHPVGYCDTNGYELSPPCNYNTGDFYWDTYLSETKSSAVPARAFKPKAPVPFEPGMKIEVVDKRNPVLVRVATIVEIENHMVQIHFDGWLDKYDYWLDDDSPDLHPPGWCAKTGHPLVPPISSSDLVVSSGPGVCPTPGCKGIGHIKGPKFSGHHSTFGCPYSEINMNKESVLVDRLGGVSREESGAPPTVIRPPEQAIEIRRCQTEGCDGSGHVTGKFPYHSKPSGCPKLHQNKEKKDPRGRKPKSYYINLAEQEARHAREIEEKELAFRQDIHNSVFMSAMITTPRNDEPLCWEQHSKLLPGVSSIVGNDVTKWGMEEVAAFVKTLPGCEEHANTFIEEQIDGEAFLLLTQSDLVKILNIKLGPALKIFNSIIMFKNTMEV